MRASDLATAAGTTVRTIRYYHQRGLLTVPPRGTTWREYGFGHLTRLMRIRWLVESGVPLSEVRHLLRPPATADERGAAIEDLEAVLGSIDAKIAALGDQRRRVDALLQRARTQGRLSPVPPSVLRMYDVMLAEPVPPRMAESIRRERDLVELLCYRDALPDEVVSLLDALDEHDLQELRALWTECYELNEQAGSRPTEATRRRVTALVEAIVGLAVRADPTATRRLMARAGELDRPAVRGIVDLAYPSPVYRQVVADVVRLSRQALVTDTAAGRSATR